MKRKHIFLSIGLVIIVAGLFAYRAYTKGPRDLREEKVDLAISATDLFEDFNADESSANAKYLDKVISVQGEITSIDKGAVTSIVLETGDMLSKVVCELASSDLPDGVNVGNELRIKGQCTGFLSDVILVKCVIE